MSIYDLLPKLKRVKQSGDKWLACCPAHNDRNPSLAVSEGKDGRVLLHCHAGCKYEAIVSALGLQPSDLGGAVQQKEDVKTGPRLAETYDYVNEQDELVFQVVRYEPKSFRQRRPDGNGGWKWNTKGIEKPLYRLPDVLRAKQANQIIFFVEGEKDVNALVQLGVCATCNSGGAVSRKRDGYLSKWVPAFTHLLSGANVVIIGDNDDVGKVHSALVAQELHSAAASIKNLNLPNRTGLVIKDAADWVAAGGTTKELNDLAGAAPLWTPSNPGPVLEVTADRPNSGWDPVMAFDAPAHVPTFPIDVLPSPYGEYAREIAKSLQVPVDMPAVLMLGVIALAAAKRYEVHVGKTHDEPLNIFILALMEPGERKSGTFRHVFAPVMKHEARILEFAELSIRLATENRAQEEERQKTLRNKYARAKDDESRDKLRQQSEKLVQTLTEIPTPPRLLVSDCTPEYLAMELAQNGGRIAQVDTEGSCFFDIVRGRYSSGGTPNMEHYLRGHCGDAIRVGRVGRGSQIIDNPAITAIFTSQPAILGGMASGDALRQRGLLARFLYSLPKSNVGNRVYSDHPLDDLARRLYEEAVTSLLETDASQPTKVLSITGDALALWAEGHDSIEAELGPDGRLHGVRDWAAKFPGAIARIAGHLHLMKHHDAEARPSEISQGTVKDARSIGDYFLGHALAAFEKLGGHTDRELAKGILAWIQRHGRREFARSELYNHLRNRESINRSEDLDPGLEILVERNYLNPLPAETSRGRGRKPSPRYEVNPVLLSDDTNQPS